MTRSNLFLYLILQARACGCRHITERSDLVVAEAKREEGDELNNLLLKLPRVTNWGGMLLYQYQGFWCPERAIPGAISFQNNFRERDSDIILASSPKCGTTWLKGLMSLIAYRGSASSSGDLSNSPLVSRGAHEVIPPLELQLYLNGRHSPDIENFTAPRIFSTHLPYAALPELLKDSACKIVYVCRNPLDMFISLWHFSDKIRPPGQVDKLFTLEESFEMFCQGIHNFGPFWDHALGFWRASLERPEKVLFLKYEDMLDDTAPYVKTLADFMGFPFSPVEQAQGKIQEITGLCSFEEMKNFDAHRNGRRPLGFSNTAYFRKGVVGDWVNYLKPDMAQRLVKITQEKLGGSGLSFQMPLQI